MLDFIKKHKMVLLYLVFGALTTLVNVLAYWTLAHPLALSTLPATIIAWLLSVIFAFFTNKLFVFESKGGGARTFWREALSFLLSRLLTGALDTAIMLVFVDILHFDDMLIKIISNIVVIILNFIISKFIIFAKKRDKGDEK